MKIIENFLLVSLFLFIISNSIEVANNRKPVVTIVSGLWDIGRGNVTLNFKRTFKDYLGFL